MHIIQTLVSKSIDKKPNQSTDRMVHLFIKTTDNAGNAGEVKG